MRSALAVGVGLLLILSSLFLKVGAINGMSATFDEPFQIFEGVYYHQQGKWQTRDVHSPLLSWLVGAISPKIAPFQDKKNFQKTR